MLWAGSDKFTPRPMGWLESHMVACNWKGAENV